jgi:hypothetical protein
LEARASALQASSRANSPLPHYNKVLV